MTLLITGILFSIENILRFAIYHKTINDLGLIFFQVQVRKIASIIVFNFFYRYAIIFK